MKKIMSILVFIILAIAPMAFAQSEADNTAATTETTIDDAQTDDSVTEESEGIAADSALYGLDLALEKLRLKVTFNEEKKAKLLLKYSQERRAEAKGMINKGKAKEAKDAADAIETNVEEAKVHIKKAKDKGRNTTEIEGELEEK